MSNSSSRVAWYTENKCIICTENTRTSAVTVNSVVIFGDKPVKLKILIILLIPEHLFGKTVDFEVPDLQKINA